MSPSYQIEAGTLIGETRNEVYNMYGENAYNTAHYGWHNVHVDRNTIKTYNLVNTSSGTKFLISLTKYEVSHPTNSYLIPENSPGIVNFNQPIEIYFEWKDANIPFIAKYELDAAGIQYTL